MSYIILTILTIMLILCICFLCYPSTQEGMSGKSSSKKKVFRTCYPTGSGDIEKCFNELPQGKADGVYITSVKVGSNFCPWDNGGDPGNSKPCQRRRIT